MNGHFQHDDIVERCASVEDRLRLENRYAASLVQLTANLKTLRDAMLRQQDELNRLAVATLPAGNSKVLPS
jgi:hypothetical protein